MALPDVRGSGRCVGCRLESAVNGRLPNSIAPREIRQQIDDNRLQGWKPMSAKNNAEFELKKLSTEAVAAAFEKVEQYRLLNEPREAESICRDILDVDPANQHALTMLLLSLTDQFRTARRSILEEARALLPQLDDGHERAYYAGIICERQGKAAFHRQQIGGGKVAYCWLRDAMEYYEQAEQLSAPGNDNARLRWNACARMIMEDDGICAEAEGESQPSLE
jgi:hypothetical protein